MVNTSLLLVRDDCIGMDEIHFSSMDVSFMDNSETTFFVSYRSMDGELTNRAA